MIGKKTTFTDKEIKYLQQNYLIKTNRQLAGALGKTLTVVRNKLYELGLARYSQKERIWTAAEDKVLIDLYKSTGDTAIGAIIGRSNKSVRKRRITLKLTRTVEEIRAIVDNNLIKFKQTSFKKGNKPKTNPAKAWQTRRQRDKQPVEVIIKRIQRREKCNFYR